MDGVRSEHWKYCVTSELASCSGLQFQWFFLSMLLHWLVSHSRRASHISAKASLYVNQVAPSGWCLPQSCFNSIKRPGVFYSPTEGMPVLPRVTVIIKFTSTHLYTLVDRGTVRVKCLADISGLIFSLVDAICNTGSRKTLDDGCTISDDCSTITCKIDFVDKPITFMLQV